MSDEQEEQAQVYVIQFDGDDNKSGVVHKDGIATATFPNNDIFVGSYVGGKRNGPGTYTFASGSRYEGDYKDNLRDGRGVFTSPDGGSYTGDWQNNHRHGQGIYRYPNGDVYTGGWYRGHKHGHGTYVFAQGGTIHGHWVEGQCIRGHWHHPNSPSYSGQLQDNQLQGPGVFTHANHPQGFHQTGVHSGTQWHHDPEFVKPDAFAVPPAATPADHHTQALRSIERAVLKLDHFQAIYRLPKLFDGVPNFRRVDNFPVFGTGQPTLSGITTVLQHLTEQGFSNFIWTCMRQEPVIYVNHMSFAPREPHNLNENMEFENITPDLLHQLQDNLASKFKQHSKEHGAVDYYQDTFAENPADRKNLLFKDPVQSVSDVRTLNDAYQYLQEQHNFEVQLKRLAIADERAPRPCDFDTLVSHLKDADFSNTALLFNCQMGKGRTTTGMVCACLMIMVKNGDVSQDGKTDASADEKEDAEDEASEDADEDQDEEKHPRKPRKTSAPVIPVSFPENPPNLSKGEFKVIVNLVAELPDGLHSKKDVDRAIDGAHHMQNLRECILYTKEMYDKETPERRKFWKRMAVNFIERYFYLICFQSYLRQHIAGGFETSFVQWCAEHPKLFAILGTREVGALAEFEWD